MADLDYKTESQILEEMQQKLRKNPQEEPEIRPYIEFLRKRLKLPVAPVSKFPKRPNVRRQHKPKFYELKNGKLVIVGKPAKKEKDRDMLIAGAKHIVQVYKACGKEFAASADLASEIDPNGRKTLYFLARGVYEGFYEVDLGFNRGSQRYLYKIKNIKL